MNLAIARKSRLLSQWIVGRQMGFSQAKYSMIERGQVPLSESDKQRIAEILRMAVEDIKWPEPPAVGNGAH